MKLGLDAFFSDLSRWHVSAALTEWMRKRPSPMKTCRFFVICQWYVAHREAGGERDPIVDHIIREIDAAEASDIAALQLGRGVMQ